MLIVHWHDLGRYLGVYGHADVSSPRLDQLAAEGILFTRAHATAPLCSPSRGSLFTGRYPQSNGLVGLAHHGWEYRADVRTLPADPVRIGLVYSAFRYAARDVVPGAARLRRIRRVQLLLRIRRRARHAMARATAPDAQPFLLTAGFFETHRPVSARPLRTRRPPTASTCPTTCPTPTTCGRISPTSTASITVADAAVGQLLDTLADTGLDRTTWVVFMTDHGPALPRAKSTLYDAGTGIALIVRPPRGPAIEPQVYDELFSGVDLVPTLLELLGVDVPADIDGISHARSAARRRRRRQARARPRSTPRRPITTPSTRSGRSGRRSTATSRTTRRGRCSTCRGISRTAHPAWRSRRSSRDRVRRANSTTSSRTPPSRTTCSAPDATDKAEAIANDLALLLHDWRQKTNDVIPSEFAGTRIAERYTETYLRIHGTARDQPIGDRRGPRHRRRIQQ